MEPVFNTCPFTLNTTRICADNSVSTAVEISRIGFTNMKPNAVILVNKAVVFDGISASALVHHPINASILFTDGGRLSKETLEEIRRLDPKGYNGTQVFLVGNVSRNVALKLNSLGYTTQAITGRNHYETACRVAAARKDFRNILIVSGESYSEALVTPYWSAHHGDPILFVQKDKIPACTLETIRRMPSINIYIIGSEKTVSKTIEDTLKGLHNVNTLRRIDGSTPYEISVNFAKYKDNTTGFGWGRNYREGHAFTFGTHSNPMITIAGMLFAHMGKHTPLLLIEKNMMPDIVSDYLKSVKPIPPMDMPRPPFMHGFILGNTSIISYPAQVNVEELISIDSEMEHGQSHSYEQHDTTQLITHDYRNNEAQLYKSCDHCSPFRFISPEEIVE